MIIMMINNDDIMIMRMIGRMIRMIKIVMVVRTIGNLFLLASAQF